MTHCVGFIAAAANRHTSNCGLPRGGTKAWRDLVKEVNDRYGWSPRNG